MSAQGMKTLELAINENCNLGLAINENCNLELPTNKNCNPEIAMYIVAN
jgi:hypothetical protein